MSLLSVRNMTKHFGGLTAVDSVSFDVFEGTIKALIGPNGAGKSTLFNLLTSFEVPDHGTAEFEGKSLVGIPPHAVVRVGVARTFQNTQLFEEMTAEENVLVGMHTTTRAGLFDAAFTTPRMRAAERDAAARTIQLLRLVGANAYADVPAADIPHGVRRLLEIARALATRPRLLLLDEPAAGLNTAETRALAGCLRRIRDDGVTLLIVEHDMGLVMDVAEEILVLDRGRKIAEGPPLLIQKDAAVIEAYLGEEGARA